MGNVSRDQDIIFCEPVCPGSRRLPVRTAIVEKPPTHRPEVDASDGVLVRRLADGDHDALEALYDRYVRPSFALARRITGDKVFAEEVVQEVFLALWRDPAKYDPLRGGFPSWLLAATHHKAVDAVRREQTVRSRRASLAEEADYYTAAPAADLPPVEDAAWAGLRGERVRKALSTLPSPQREALVLAYYAGYTQSEIAERTGAPLGTVKTRMLAGMRRLRQQLDEVADSSTEGARP
jgi:RNA polymerase sigma-70 factor (ECF subfamily)